MRQLTKQEPDSARILQRYTPVPWYHTISNSYGRSDLAYLCISGTELPTA